jgi:hypothetical protein
MSKALEKLDDSIETQQKKLDQLKARKQAVEARLRAEEKKRSRQQDTRRKILAGAFFLDAAGGFPLAVDVHGKTLEHFLTRDDDRALFGLLPLAQIENNREQPQGHLQSDSVTAI